MASESEKNTESGGKGPASERESTPSTDSNTTPNDNTVQTHPGGASQPSTIYNQHTPPDIRDLQQHGRPGDFSSDLLPSVGGGANPMNDPTGNLMGPNHPAFRGGQPPEPRGGYGMRPRFDPFGPPGGPTDPRNIDPSRNVDPSRNPQHPRQPRPPPGGAGEPNPDHERPPSDLSNKWFM
jgi:hypothetical protein